MEAENQTTNNTTPPDEIDLIEVIRYIWDGRWLIVKVTGVFVVIGLIVALTSQEQYKAEARLLPEVRDTQGGASQLLRQFGGFGGLNLPLGQGIDAIRPELYPEILKSTPFFLYLMEQEITPQNLNGNEVISVFCYLDLESSILKKTIGRVQEIFVKGGFKRPDSSENNQNSLLLYDISQMSKTQFEIKKKLSDRINAGIDNRSGIISISSEFPDPIVSAQIAQYSLNYLTKYITRYRIDKAQKDLEFIVKRYEEKKNDFHLSQLNLANFRDANRNIITASAQTEEQRLQDQYNLDFNVYNGLAQQLEQARIKVQEETPVITVLEPVNVPVKRSAPKRVLIVFFCVVLGTVGGISFLIVRLSMIRYAKK
jgi:uncharacterized protein involved in exopolysaccharide biosynthesis